MAPALNPAFDQDRREGMERRGRAVDFLEQHSAEMTCARWPAHWPGAVTHAHARARPRAARRATGDRRARGSRRARRQRGSPWRRRCASARVPPSPTPRMPAAARRTSPRCRTGWPDRSRRAPRQVRAPSLRTMDPGASAADRALRAARTAWRRAPRRSTRAAAVRCLPSPSAPGRSIRIPRARFRVRRPRGSAHRGAPAAAAPGRQPAASRRRARVCWRARQTRLHRPSADGGTRRRDRKDGASARRRSPPRGRRARVRPQRVERVVGDAAGPDEIPQRIDRFGRVAAAGRVVERTEERRAAGGEVVDDRPLARSARSPDVRDCCGRRSAR